MGDVIIGTDPHCVGDDRGADTRNASPGWVAGAGPAAVREALRALTSGGHPRGNG